MCAQAMQRTQGVSPVLVQVIEGLVIMILLAFDATAWSTLREALSLSRSVPSESESGAPPHSGAERPPSFSRHR